LRVQKTEGGVARKYLFDGVRVYSEHDATMVEQARFMIEGGSYYSPLTAVRVGGAWYYPLYDKLGSTRRLVDANQTVTDAYWYDAFGSVTSQWGSTYNPYRYVGSLGYYSADTTTSLLHLGARYYSPQVGRFWTQDPVREGANWYSYVGSSPPNLVDADGLAVTRKVPDIDAAWKKCIARAVGGYSAFGKTAAEREKYRKIVRCVIWAESGDSPKAKNPGSSTRGLMQILKCHDTACTKLLGHAFDPFDPCDNVTCGSMLLAEAVKRGAEERVYVSMAGQVYKRCMKGYIYDPKTW
jgi:RHS repeat-associated protein